MVSGEAHIEEAMSLQARPALLKQFAPQYCKASSKRKRLLLDAFAEATGYHRRYGMWLLNHAEEVSTRPRYQRVPRYGPEVQQVLFLVWHAANRICTKRLMPYLPTWLDVLERHEAVQITPECRAQLLTMSAATADRLLRSQRMRGLRGISTRHQQAPCSNGRSPFVPISSGMNIVPAFWKSIWWPIAA